MTGDMKERQEEGRKGWKKQWDERRERRKKCVEEIKKGDSMRGRAKGKEENRHEFKKGGK